MNTNGTGTNDLFSWNNKYNKYNEYSITDITDTFTCFFLAMHTTYSLHAGILKPWRGRLLQLLAVFSFCHVFSLPLSGLNWRSLFPPWGSGLPFPKMASPFTGSAHTPLLGSETSRKGEGFITKKQLINLLKLNLGSSVNAYNLFCTSAKPQFFS